MHYMQCDSKIPSDQSYAYQEISVFFVTEIALPVPYPSREQVVTFFRNYGKFGLGIPYLGQFKESLNVNYWSEILSISSFECRNTFQCLLNILAVIDLIVREKFKSQISKLKVRVTLIKSEFYRENKQIFPVSTYHLIYLR